MSALGYVSINDLTEASFLYRDTIRAHGVCSTETEGQKKNNNPKTSKPFHIFFYCLATALQ